QLYLIISVIKNLKANPKACFEILVRVTGLATTPTGVYTPTGLPNIHRRFGILQSKTALFKSRVLKTKKFSNQT
ncbi:MAG: hypothetical protein KBS52_01400, partial [Clostridiales bacterium]|nr:hypothetical protein [Candidatus Equinaster intestinalis]